MRFAGPMRVAIGLAFVVGAAALRAQPADFSGSAGSTTLVYTRKEGVDPCEAWPTPCRW